MPGLYIPPNPPSASFAASLKPAASAKKTPGPHASISTADTATTYRDSQMVRAATTSALSPPSSLPVRPSSPRPASRGVVRQKTPSMEDRRWQGRLRTPRLSPPQRPRLKIINPKTTPVDPLDHPAPSYHEWHPTSVVWEYQLQRGFGVSEKLFQLCRFLNKAGFEKEGRVGDGQVWKGHEGRVEWLFWYWGERNRMRGVRTAREAEEIMEKEKGEAVGNRADVRLGGKGVDHRAGDELTDEEQELVRTLEEEMAEETEMVLDWEDGASVRNGTQESTMTKGAKDFVAWAADVVDGDRWWKTQKRKRN